MPRFRDNAKEREILRAAISSLTKLNDAEEADAIQGLDAIKTGMLASYFPRA